MIKLKIIISLFIILFSLNSCIKEPDETIFVDVIEDIDIGKDSISQPWSFVARKDTDIYLQNNTYKILKSDNSNINFKKITGDNNLIDEGICIKDNKLYFYELENHLLTDDFGSYLKYLDLKTNEIQYVEIDDMVLDYDYKVYFYNDSLIFYKFNELDNQNYLYISNIYGEKDIKLFEFLVNIEAFYNNYLYVSSIENGVNYRVNLNTLDKEELNIKGNICGISNDWIFYFANGMLYKSKTNGSEVLMIFDTQLEQFEGEYGYNDYFTNTEEYIVLSYKDESSCSIYVLDFDGTIINEISDYIPNDVFIDGIRVLDNNIYFSTSKLGDRKIIKRTYRVYYKGKDVNLLDVDYRGI